jgi:4-diphosphocytidyl-2-C-methyl-D-erythritol kinase
MKALFDLPAPAKLNLFLHVIGRRDDGYHLLQSVFVLIDWCDTLHFELRSDGALRRHDLAAALPADDLSLRAARLLQRESGTSLGADLSVHKRVPWGAGMGGGSSDAATTLLALNRLWQLNWPRLRLQQLAPQLGADVPFFIGGQHAFVEGIGERLTPLQLPRAWYAVIKPPIEIDTRAVFASARLGRDTQAAILSGFLAGTGTSSNGTGCSNAAWGRNDLQPVAEEQYPEVVQAAEWVRQRFGNSRMTGSGSAVFASAGTGDRPAAMDSAANSSESFEGLPPGWVGRMCRSLHAHPLASWAD